MDDHTPMPKVARLEVITIGARRRWTLAEKLRIIEESHIGARQASATARRHGLSTSQLFAWRKLAREGRLEADNAAGLTPAMIIADAIAETPIPSPPPSRTHAPGRMEIVVEAGRVIVDASVDQAALARVLSILAQRRFRLPRAFGYGSRLATPTCGAA